MAWATGRRRIVAAVAAVGVVAATAIVAYRVLAPAEVVTTARADYPALLAPEVGVVGRLPVAPLIVDGRLRVYAAQRQVYADQPADGPNRRTPYWSYRRWPATLDAVVTSGTTVVSRWSDGQLVALDARTGQVAWRADGPEPAGERVVRRTDAAVVWQVPEFFAARTADGRDVLVSAGRDEVRAVDVVGGVERWRATAQAGCGRPIGSSTTGQLVAVADCDGPTTVEFRDAATGVVVDRWQPPGDVVAATLVGCGPDGCAGLRTAGPGDAGGQGWLFEPSGPVAAPALDGPGSELIDGTAVTLAGGTLVGRSVRDDVERWRLDVGAGRVLAVQPGRVHVLTEENDLVTADPATGAQLSRFPLDVGWDGTGWAPGAAYATSGFVAVERLRRPVDPEGDDQRYYLTSEAVILAAT